MSRCTTCRFFWICSQSELPPNGCINWEALP